MSEKISGSMLKMDVDTEKARKENEDLELTIARMEEENSKANYSRLPSSSKRPSWLASRVESMRKSHSKWQDRRRWSTSFSDGDDLNSTPDVAALRREALLSEARNQDISILGRRPDQVSVTVHRCKENRSWGCRFAYNADMECVEIESVSPKEGLLSIENPCARYMMNALLLQPGDVLDSINGVNYHDKYLGDVQALMDEVMGEVTFVFSTSSNDTVQLCQAVAMAAKVSSDSLRFAQKRGDLILQRHSCFSNQSILSQGDSLVAIGDSLCLSLTTNEAQCLLDAKTAAAPYVSITTITATPSQKRWIRARKAVVAVSGGTLVGVGAVLMASPLHPVGHAMAFGGVGVLGTEFDATHRVFRSARKRWQTSPETASCPHGHNEVPDSVDEPNSSLAAEQ